MIFLAAAAIALLTGCTTEQPPAAATGLPAGAADGQYVFTFQQGMYRYDKADSFVIIIGECLYNFLNNL